MTVEAQPGSGLARYRVNPEERTEVQAARRAVLRLARGERVTRLRELKLRIWLAKQLQEAWRIR